MDYSQADRIASALERIADTMEKQTALALASSQMGSEMFESMKNMIPGLGGDDD